MTTQSRIRTVFDKEKIVLRMRRRGTIQGILLGQNHLPLSQTSIFASNIAPDDANPSWDVYVAKKRRTLGDGSFEFTGLTAGMYKISLDGNNSNLFPVGQVYLGIGHELTIEVKALTTGDNAKVAIASMDLKDSHVGLGVSIDNQSVEVVQQDGRHVFYPPVGKEYLLTIRNDWKKKLLAVLTVDGLSVMNGAPGGFHSRGYIIRPSTTIKIPGWRLNNEEVAKFVFQTRDKAYASLMHMPDNIGVIACAFFEEKDHKPIFDDTDILYSSASLYSLNSPHIGTGFGERSEHQVVTAEFERKEKPSIIKTIYYVADIGQAAHKSFNPNPFPGCTHPPGWRG